jgi:hypothetical protein
VKNSKLVRLKVDHLYHIALDTEKDDLQAMFGDVKVHNIRHLLYVRGIIWLGAVVGQYYVIFVSDLRQVGGVLWVLRFPPLMELTATI